VNIKVTRMENKEKKTLVRKMIMGVDNRGGKRLILFSQIRNIKGQKREPSAIS
jgi:hypothetical protein